MVQPEHRVYLMKHRQTGLVLSAVLIAWLRAHERIDALVTDPALLSAHARGSLRPMKAALDFYRLLYAARYPVICIDERSKQLLDETLYHL